MAVSTLSISRLARYQSAAIKPKIDTRATASRPALRPRSKRAPLVGPHPVTETMRSAASRYLRGVLVFALAAVDAAVGAYLIRYALPRERRDKDAVLAVGISLVFCSALLVGLALWRDSGGGSLPPLPGRQRELPTPL